MEDVAGETVYCFAGNNPIGFHDPLGLAMASIDHPSDFKMADFFKKKTNRDELDLSEYLTMAAYVEKPGETRQQIALSTGPAQPWFEHVEFDGACGRLILMFGMAIHAPHMIPRWETGEKLFGPAFGSVGYPKLWTPARVLPDGETPASLWGTAITTAGKTDAGLLATRTWTYSNRRFTLGLEIFYKSKPPQPSERLYENWNLFETWFGQYPQQEEYMYEVPEIPATYLKSGETVGIHYGQRGRIAANVLLTVK